MWRAGIVSSTTLPTRTERVVPYVLTLIYYGMTYYVLRRTLGHPVVLSFFFAPVLALLLTLLITLRWKISAHMVGIGGLVGALLGLMIIHGTHAPMVLVLAFIAAGALGTARLLDSDHTPAQVYAGAALGTTCMLACILLGIAP
jgi:membrane associated rhomboid family serine protease